MRFKQAVQSAKGYRFIARDINDCLFDVIKYQPEHLDEEDLLAMDWRPIDLEEVKEIINK